jgi:uncharacterized Ntn-hydrolase superfamily protein
MTFSIIGFDNKNEMIGSAVASCWTGVGGCVQFFRPHVGLVNIQNHSHAQVAYRILDNMETSDDLDYCIEDALSTDSAKTLRQCVVASLKSKSVQVYSGSQNTETYHHLIGKSCAAAGNTLADENVIGKMIDAFDNNEDKTITERLILALEAGQEAGGDSRGQEAAAVKSYSFSYPAQRYYPIDLRVDHHKAPIEELRKLYKIFDKNERRITT